MVLSLDARRILLSLGFAASPLTSREFSEYLGEDFREVSRVLRRLSRRGYVVRQRGVYTVTDKGLSLVRRKLYFKVRRVIRGGRKVHKFRFFKRKGEYTGVEVGSLKELVEVLRVISPDSLKYHVEKYDLQRWIEEELGDDFLLFLIGQKLEEISDAFDLRDFLYEVFSDRLNNLMALEKRLLEIKESRNI